jgi:hypothetical protein
MIIARKCLAGGLVLLLVAGLAQADELPTFHFELGAYKSDFDTTLRIDGEEIGSEIDLEDDLNFDSDDTAFRLDGYWRFADRHRVMFAYYDLTRDATALLTEDIIIDDVLYPAGSEVKGGFDIWVLQLAYSYSVVQTKRGELGLSIGVHWPGIDFSLRPTSMRPCRSSAWTAATGSSTGCMPRPGCSTSPWTTRSTTAPSSTAGSPWRPGRSTGSAWGWDTPASTLIFP